jgi:hypothetical protein
MTLKLTAQLLAAAFLGGTTTTSQAADLFVICAPTVSLSAADVRDVFLGEKQFAGSIKLAPADNTAAQTAFLEKVLKIDAAKYSTSWTKKSFRDGVTPPVTKGSDAEALEYVKHTPGACSYVTTEPSAGAVVIAKY